MPRFRDPKRANRNDGFADIPYPDLAQSLLSSNRQRFVPVLGAGASRPFTPRSTPSTPAASADMLQDLAARLGVRNDDARLFLEIAVAIIGRLNAEESTPSTTHRSYDVIRNGTTAPSASELAQALAERSAYDHFAGAKRRIAELTGRSEWDDERLTRLLASMARLTGICSPTPSLVDASSYHAFRKPRAEFWSDLYQLFENKKEPTDTHRLVATAAGNYLKANRDDSTAPDWLVITTNYDCLLETAFDAALPPVPYYVITVPTANPPIVDLRFSAGAQSYLGFSDAQFREISLSAFEAPDYVVPIAPPNFSGLGSRPRPLVNLYKIHGSLHAGATPDRDGVVITNEDYVEFISDSKRVPVTVVNRLRGLRLLLLGYSFSDWNVRSLYRSVTQYRQRRAAPGSAVVGGDYAVLYEPSAYETSFFDAKQIDVLDTTLDQFTQRIREAVGR